MDDTSRRILLQKGLDGSQRGFHQAEAVSESFEKMKPCWRPVRRMARQGYLGLCYIRYSGLRCISLEHFVSRLSEREMVFRMFLCNPLRCSTLKHAVGSASLKPSETSQMGSKYS